jgi:nitric oxide reductase large subunit
MTTEERRPRGMKRLWVVLVAVMVFGFTVLGWIGSRIHQKMPLLSLLFPIGLLQTGASVQYGYWYARCGRPIVAAP